MEGNMRVLIARDDGQLRKLESSIAALNARPQAERDRRGALIAALEAERSEILRSCSRR
jgi:hypothetical protein